MGSGGPDTRPKETLIPRRSRQLNPETKTPNLKQKFQRSVSVVIKQPYQQVLVLIMLKDAKVLVSK